MASFNPLGTFFNSDGSRKSKSEVFRNFTSFSKLGGVLGDEVKEEKDKDSGASAPSTREAGATVDAEDEERLKRVGRAQLISSSSRGVLTNSETSTKKLFGV